jgi:hypothetical protein
MLIAWIVLLTSIRVIELTVLQSQGIILAKAEKTLSTHLVTAPVLIAYRHRLWTSESELNRNIRHIQGLLQPNIFTFQSLFVIFARNSTEQTQ